MALNKTEIIRLSLDYGNKIKNHYKISPLKFSEWICFSFKKGALFFFAFSLVGIVKKLEVLND